MPGNQPLRGKKFPSLVSEAGAGYVLQIPVPGQPGHVAILPPQSIIQQETYVWPAYTFQLLLVASEYCAALLEFMTWSFPKDWDPLKAQVAGHARQLLRSSAAVPPPAVQPGSLRSWQARNAHSVWAAFTYCYFHGLAPVSASVDSNAACPPDWQEATTWLHRLVGETGWQPDGRVALAAQQWVTSMRDRLGAAYPTDAPTWLSTDAAGEKPTVVRKLGTCGNFSQSEEESRFYPIYPLRVTGGFGRNQVKWKVAGKDCGRTISGSCGVPSGFDQTSNCALGFLVLADVIDAYVAATKTPLKDRVDLQSSVRQTFLGTVVCSDVTELPTGHTQYGYPAYLASCALGWELALQQLPHWLAGTAGSAAAAGWSAENLAAQGLHMELVMPGDMELLGVEDALRQLQPQPSPTPNLQLLNGMELPQRRLSFQAESQALPALQPPAPLRMQEQPASASQPQLQLHLLVQPQPVQALQVQQQQQRQLQPWSSPLELQSSIQPQLQGRFSSPQPPPPQQLTPVQQQQQPPQAQLHSQPAALQLQFEPLTVSQQQQPQQSQQLRQPHPTHFATVPAAADGAESVSAAAASFATLQHGGGGIGVVTGARVLSGHSSMPHGASAHSFTGQALPPFHANAGMPSHPNPTVGAAGGSGLFAKGLAHGGGGGCNGVLGKGVGNGGGRGVGNRVGIPTHEPSAGADGTGVALFTEQLGASLLHTAFVPRTVTTEMPTTVLR